MSDPMPGGAGVPPPLRPLPWLAGALAAAALLAAVDPGPTPVDAGLVTGSIELGGSAASQAVADGSGSLTLGGSADTRAEPTGSGSLSLGGSGAAEAVAASAGSLLLGGSGAASAEPVAAGSLDLGGTSAASASAVSAGSISLGGTGTWTTLAAGSLDLGGSAAPGSGVSASGSLDLGSSGAGQGSGAGSGSLTLGGTGAGTARPSAAGSLTLGGTVAPTGRAAGSGSLTLGGTATGVKLGVLNVWDGSTWKVIGCGGDGSTVGRLKLWDGTQWVQEACDASGGFTDTFTRANSASGGIGNGWVYCGIDFNPAPYSGTSKPDDWQILSNQAYCSTHTYLGTLAEGKLKGIVQSTTTADFDMTVTARTTYAAGTGANTGLAFRRNTANGSFLWWTPDAVYYYNSSGAQSTFDAFTISLVSGDVLRIVGSGTTVLFYKNGVLQHTGLGYTTNNTATCTQHGLMNSQSFGAAAIWVDFALTDPAVVARPLYVWTGTAWDRVACMVPA